MSKFWLLKAEPDSRIVKGKDVKVRNCSLVPRIPPWFSTTKHVSLPHTTQFSVDDFESVKTSPWEGVRNYEARNLMKEMKIGDKALFYHSNCKNPERANEVYWYTGIAAFAEVSKEAYPDYTAWDESHPYYDAKSNKESPKWFMVDLTFTSRANHFIPLSLLRYIANFGSGSGIPEQIAYIGDEGVKAIKAMDLVTRGRLSVQGVDENAWETIGLLADKGGWDGLPLDKKPSTSTPKASASASATPAKRTATPRTKRASAPTSGKAVKSKKKAKDESDNEDEGDAYQASEPSSEDNYESDDGSDYGKSKSKRGAPSRGTKRKTRGKGDDDDDDYTGRSSKRKSQRKN
ncbi:hypothetical protein PQX77_011725 [Marasmius sp. AFHP31]|nr:hypothetical protein PQX77_011725 [Marasmius sp. AFHP31]